MLKIKQPKLYGVRMSYYGDSWTKWVCIPNPGLPQNPTIDDIEEITSDALGNFAYLFAQKDCMPGGTFQLPPSFKVTKRRILITGSGGYDV